MHYVGVVFVYQIDLLTLEIAGGGICTLTGIGTTYFLTIVIFFGAAGAFTLIRGVGTTTTGAYSAGITLGTEVRTAVTFF